MNFVAELWREVGRHLEMEESLRRFVPLLAARLPIDGLLVRRLDREPMRLTTIASARRTSDDDGESPSMRSECDDSAGRELLRFLSEDQPQLIEQGDSSPLGRAILPAGLGGAAIALPLAAENRPLGVVLMLALTSSSASELPTFIAMGMLLA